MIGSWSRSAEAQAGAAAYRIMWRPGYRIQGVKGGFVGCGERIVVDDLI
jgi:hypothetical protein